MGGDSIMTKNYDIIALNNHLYMIDKEASIKEKDWRTDGVEIRQDFPDAWPKWNKILASTDTSLGLPLLPDIEEDILELLKKKFPDYDNLPQGVKFDLKNGFMEGYKAASAKKYTEEDMRNAILRAWDSSIDTKNIDDIISSLTPKPIAVELEMEDVCCGLLVGVKKGGPIHESCGYCSKGKDTVPKVVNNIVQIKRWIYE